MALSFTEKKRIRKSFGRIPEAIEMPNLIEVQRESYEHFLQMHTPADKRTDDGLGGVFKSVFPISDFSERATLEYVSYEFETPKFDVEECVQRDLTYQAPLKVRLQLVVFDVDEDTGARSVKEVKEQECYLGDIPLMTDKGTFVVNGTERVIVSQMHRSPGVFFDHDKGKTHASGKLLFAARIIPYRGSWLDFEFDAKDVLNIRIDRKRKLPATTMLYALGYDTEQILDLFYTNSIYRMDKAGWITGFRADAWKGVKPEYDLVDAKTGKSVAEAGKKITALKAKRIAEANTDEILVPSDALVGKFLARDVVNTETGEIFGEAGDMLEEEIIAEMRDYGISTIEVLDIDASGRGPWLRNTLKADKNETRFEALSDIYRVMRPGEPPTQDAADALFGQLFFDPERYDLSAVGRVKMNMRLNVGVPGYEAAPDDMRVLRHDDILGVMKVILDLKDGKGEVDDIDNLGNRRVRSVGELMENNYRIGLVRMERAIKERMGSVDIDTVMPHDLINAKPVVASVREFFGSSQLSQFMDQTNPLSEITHKRRLSALGPGGLTRERAGFEVRDVHPTHYGRICPIETPEGPNIGLINSLATHARVNKYGFIESPYRKVVNGKQTDEVVYLSAMEESIYSIAQANATVDEKGMLANEFVNARVAGEATMVSRDDIQFMDVSPKQVVSVAASLIPYLENDDANRALMGSNMQRQAVPLVQSEAPFVGTGMEAVVARDSRAAITARRSGVVEQVDAMRIVVRATEDLEGSKSGVDIYRLAKFRRSNQNSCINQRPIVRVGDVVSKSDIIADGPSTDLGDLALGRNVLVAFMPWNGYNFEDSILISERIVKDDVFTSIHIEEFEVAARDTKLGPEEITRDIPNVGEEALRNLDEAGIVAVGAEVKAGDILVGKVTPKGESPMTPEEKLLRAIFGEKASDVRDTSLRVPPGDAGTVVDVRIFNRHGIDKDQRALQIEREQIEKLQEDKEDEQAILERNTYNRLRDLLTGKEAAAGPKGFTPGKISASALDELSETQMWDIALKSEKAQADLDALRDQFDGAIGELEARFNDKVEKVQRGDDLPPGVMKVVKVFLAVKRKLQPGDKMAGRHGNKGVISKINPQEDMPFLEDGTPVDIVLNPLGVPSRMNVGQILETHTGWACRGLGRIIQNALDEFHQNNDVEGLKKALKTAYGEEQELPAEDSEIIELAGNLRNGVPMATPVFDGARESDINAMLERAGLDSSGQVKMFDGRTGVQFSRPVTVGYKYLLKLHHLVDEKIHARSTGPYSLVTQQPLGGKAQFGGQRFGEMEVWALEAYGAAYTLQEMLTVKSDDTAGRAKVYEAIVRGDDTFEAGIPESFNVLVKEMRSLGLNVELIEEGGGNDDADTPVAAE
ncbi:MAG TPA: DNA-directed RNA polymerase subunit beta [Hyphomonas sp.]|jgi:DNA-directed RNA polymerase subunit beta|uniref:DNA-directed RNA polymerase n=13 Tax=root TaxID=1 RepID=A0A161JQI0_9ZZZZ|nr:MULTISPECIES: DNA-directed RNA polymerase subunit beta [unclassified Hyphomonas]MAL47583.1 DNA-directed RNA polymerase subunit beta [Hyphomonas sp.]MBO6583357.1 DNA-directed RNA polymerase subunit beta [Hyphomonas sp.]QSR21605.1 DNA-directed RNA polymerase subunit beta [Hyphomonas sp. KY3]HBN92985.1 DNA-directed RNA polymerase subunit beta [Hyphomonas sp.]HBU34635.1 DNA-directed RNA polymerase subunit beta [Hyphomonas sp.]|tara:strand:+ start:193323 stop:197456 length:4134 start_codon:yes stop_codon:yes gene_type:complete